MPRRSGRTSIANSVHPLTPEQTVSALPPTCLDPSLAILRTQWKWAVFSQFITTFQPLLNMADVTITDVENDLVSGSRKAIPRIMQRLLYTLSYDRKISLENWQSALRKQYMKRDPFSNPLGPEPPKEQDMANSREETPENSGAEISQRDLDKEGLDAPSDETERRLLLEQSATTSEISRAATQELEGSSHQSNGNQITTDWFDLPMLSKLDSLHLLAEWQFQNPTRLRTLMKSDDELATWRHEPIGYDSKKNAYWLIGGDRLWIQRIHPKPAKTLKRKRPAEAGRAGPPVERAGSPKRPRTKVASTKVTDTSRGTRQGRAAKLQAKMKLDAQAKELAELNRQAKIRSTRTSTRLSKNTTQTASRPLGTRISARLRGTQDSEWQPMPDEWLDGMSDAKRHTTSDDEKQVSREQKHARESGEDDISELTELSDDSDSPDSPPLQESAQLQDEHKGPSAKGTPDGSVKEEVENASVDGFIEWETICVTLEEWEHIAERFEKATHYLERALYRYLTAEIVPNITEALREIEKKRRIEEALVHRKRSSRIAMKESEREEARLVAQRQAEEEEKMSRARRLEARRQREEEERLRREQAREERRKDREARELRRQAEAELGQDDYASGTDNPSENGLANTPTQNPPAPARSRRNGRAQDPKNHFQSSVNATSSKTTKSGDWELDCEICGRRGVNLDDSTPMMSCGTCFKWQHIVCHDQADERAGRAKRNWDVVEFLCQQCRSRMFQGTGILNSSLRDPQLAQRQPQGVNFQPPYHGSTLYQTYLPQGYGAAALPPSSAISTLYHAANGNYSHYTQPYGNVRTVGTSDRYSTPGQPIMPPPHHYNQPPTTISFSHYQPREGVFSSNTKAQSSYVNGFNQHPPASHVHYSDLRSSTSQRSNVSSPAQTVWNITTPGTAGSYTNPYQSGANSTAVSRPERQPQSNLKPGSLPELNHTTYPNTQFRYHSTA